MRSLLLFSVLRIIKEAITNVKQQCSDFVMTRSIQCREMIEEVQRQISGLSFQDSKSSSGYAYPSVGQPQQAPRANPQLPPDTGNIPNHPRPQNPTYQPPQQPTMPGYSQTPPYGSPQPPAPPYNFPGQGQPYPHPQHQQQPPQSHEYGQPAYPGWRGPYYNAPPQQPGAMSRPPYTAPSPYPHPPPHQSGYYRQ
nr:vacuolar-sorting protein BRO1-like isoform X3 [Nicotiana tomentosiformis]